MYRIRPAFVKIFGAKVRRGNWVLSGVPYSLHPLQFLRCCVIFRTMKRLKIAFTLLIIAVLSLIGYSIYNRADLIARGKAPRKTVKPKSEFSLVSPRFVEMRGDVKILEIDADEALYSRSEQFAELTMPKTVYYDKEGRPTFIEGEKGTINTDTNDIELRGKVMMRSPDGFMISTPSVSYVNAPKLVKTKAPVFLQGNGFKVKGVGFRVDVEKQNYRILNRVEATIIVKEGSFFVRP